ncbi:hypothetical protein LIER_07994 [Lithospermum erythrorhizon]|uniref:Uncharacterized protein n=1 Tax=Lithospermum erythrorhizon TaxID=34254 RepID=A0AAV3PAC8_LITER
MNTHVKFYILSHEMNNYIKILGPFLHSSDYEWSSNSVGTSMEDGAKWIITIIDIWSMQKPLAEFLKEYDLPIGIFPSDATNYEFNEQTKKLAVHIPSICEVGYKDSSVLRFSAVVTGYLEKGKLSDIEGMKKKKTRNRDAYEVLRSGVSVDKF